LKISREFKIGFIVLCAIALLVWGINFLKGRDFFSSEKKYFAIYEKIEKLDIASPVILNGYQIGQVNDIYFHPDKSGRLVVIFVTTDEIDIPVNSKARIASIDFMGTRAIDLDYYDTTEYHNSGDTLLSDIEKTMEQKVSDEMLPIKVKAEELMKDLQETIEVIQYVFNKQTRDNLKKSFESITKTVQNLEHSTETIDTMLATETGRISKIFSDISSISSNIREHNDQLTIIIENFSAISDSLAKAEIASTINNADKTLKQTNEIMEKINRGEGSLGLLVNNDTLYNNIEKSAFNLNKLVEDINRNPKKYVRFSIIDFGRNPKPKE